MEVVAIALNPPSVINERDAEAIRSIAKYARVDMTLPPERLIREVLVWADGIYNKGSTREQRESRIRQDSVAILGGKGVPIYVLSVANCIARRDFEVLKKY